MKRKAKLISTRIEPEPAGKFVTPQALSEHYAHQALAQVRQSLEFAFHQVLVKSPVPELWALRMETAEHIIAVVDTLETGTYSLETLKRATDHLKVLANTLANQTAVKAPVILEARTNASKAAKTLALLLSKS